MKENRKGTGKLTIAQRVLYGFGEMGSQFSWMLISSYLSLFYTDVVGLTPAIISFIMLSARVWDGVNDPMFGAIAERTVSRWGRFRPYIIFGSPILALLTSVTFLNLNLSLKWKAIWCLVTYIGCGMAYTAVNISVGCLANSMTEDNKERTLLNSYRGVMGSVSSLVIGALTMPLILKLGHQDTVNATGFFKTAVIYSLIALPCFLVCGVTTRETIVDKRMQKRGHVVIALLRSIRFTFQDANARNLVIAEFFFLIGIFGRLGIMSYYFIYVLKNTLLIAGFASALSIGLMIANVLAYPMMRVMDKKKVGTISALFQVLCCIIFFIIGEQNSIQFVIPVGFLYGITNMSANVSYGLIAEIVDDNWIRTGIRSDGIMYSCISFATKMGNAIGGSIGILALGAVGFVAKTEMTAATLTKMNAVINFGPAIFFSLSAVFFMKNKMTNTLGEENEKKIVEMSA